MVISDSQQIKAELLELCQLENKPLISLEISCYGETIIFERITLHPHLEEKTITEFDLLYFYPGFHYGDEERDFYTKKQLVAFYDYNELPVFVSSFVGTGRLIKKLWIHWI